MEWIGQRVERKGRQGKKCLNRFFFPIDRIDESQQFGDGDVDTGGNLFFDIELGKHFDQIRILFYRNPVEPCDFQDSLCDSSRAFGSDSGGGILFGPIPKGDRLLLNFGF